MNIYIAKEIIHDAYSSKAIFRETVKLYNLSLNDVGVTTCSHDPMRPGAQMLKTYKSDAPIMLFFSLADNRVMSQAVSLRDNKKIS